MIRPLPTPEIYDGIAAADSSEVQGWHSDHPIFAHLINELEPEVIVECGTWKGASAIHMAKLTEEHAEISVQRCKIYCVDTWLGGIDHDLNQQDPTSVLPRENGYPRLYFQFLANVKRAGFQDRICPIPQTSINGGRLLNAHGIKADLVYIDGSHEHFDPYEDMKAYWPLVAPGGIMFGDDVNWPGVATSYYRFFLESGLPFRPEIVDKNFWIIRKP